MMESCNALELQMETFMSDSPVEIAQSFEDSTDLTFLINRTGTNLSSDRKKKHRSARRRRAASSHYHTPVSVAGLLKVGPLA